MQIYNDADIRKADADIRKLMQIYETDADMQKRMQISENNSDIRGETDMETIITREGISVIEKNTTKILFTSACTTVEAVMKWYARELMDMELKSLKRKKYRGKISLQDVP